MTLRAQILARIDETPHRAPTITAFIYTTSALFHTLQRELASMIDARVIDTEQGDSGLTYKRAKAAYVPHVTPRTPEVCNSAGIAYFPSKNQQPQPPKVRKTEPPKVRAVACVVQKTQAKLAAPAKAKREPATHRRPGQKELHAYLDRPMSITLFAKNAGITKKSANAKLCHFQQKGLIKGDKTEPNIYWFESMEPFDMAKIKAEAQSVKTFDLMTARGFDFEVIAEEYKRGDLVQDITKKWTCNHHQVLKALRIAGVPLRTKKQLGLILSIKARTAKLAMLSASQETYER